MVPVSVLCSSSLQHKSLSTLFLLIVQCHHFLFFIRVVKKIIYDRIGHTLVLHVGQESHVAGYTHTSMQNIISVGTIVCA